jgi:hypothetical protein
MSNAPTDRGGPPFKRGVWGAEPTGGAPQRETHERSAPG